MMSAEPSHLEADSLRCQSEEPRLVHRPLFDGSLLRIDEVVATANSERPTTERELDRHGLVLPFRGLFTTHTGRRHRVLASTHHAVLLSASTPYRYSYPGAIGDRCLVLSWRDEALERMAPQALGLDHLDLPQRAVAPPLDPAQLLAREQLRLRLADVDADPLAIEELAVELLSTVLQAAHRAPPEHRSRHDHAPSRDHARIERLKELIASAPHRRWTLEGLAVEACVSPHHLAHLFKRRMGLSVYEYVVRARLAAALQDVLETQQDLTRIALDAGFSSHSHFTAQFRARFGITPLALRRVGRRHVESRIGRIATAAPAIAS